jgi:aspartate kinase
MDIIVQKYGGSSLAEDGQLRAVAARVADAHRDGKALAVVVSARGDTTNRLLAEAGRLNSQPARRELDLLVAAGEQKSASLLALALQDIGIDAAAMTGPQAGVRTCGAHLNARIRGVEPEPILHALRNGQVAVIAGFQGAGPDGQITTLGRGGSDTTAVAIAAALGATRCEIYSDVDGVYSADPRLVPAAERIGVLGLEEMKALAHHGAGVLNERAIDYALERGVTLHARRAHGDGGQTVLRPGAGSQRARIAGVAGHKSLLCVDFTEESDPVRLAALLGGLELFTPQLARGGRGSYLLHAEQLADVPGLVAAIQQDCPRGVSVLEPLASVSAVGLHAGRDPDAAEFARARLSAQGIDVRRAFATAHAVTCLIDPAALHEAMGCFHDSYRIGDTGVAHVA